MHDAAAGPRTQHNAHMVGPLHDLGIMLLLQLLPLPDSSAHAGEASQPSLPTVESSLLEPGQRHLGWELLTAWFFLCVSQGLDQEPSLLALAYPKGNAAQTLR